MLRHHTWILRGILKTDIHCGPAYNYYDNFTCTEIEFTVHVIKFPDKAYSWHERSKLGYLICTYCVSIGAVISYEAAQVLLLYIITSWQAVFNCVGSGIDHNNLLQMYITLQNKTSDDKINDNNIFACVLTPPVRKLVQNPFVPCYYPKSHTAVQHNISINKL